MEKCTLLTQRTLTASCLEAIPVDSQIMYYIYHTENKISHFHGAWWKYLGNTVVCYSREERIVWEEKEKGREERKGKEGRKKGKERKPLSFVRWFTMPGIDDSGPGILLVKWDFSTSAWAGAALCATGWWTASLASTPWMTHTNSHPTPAVGTITNFLDTALCSL